MKRRNWKACWLVTGNVGQRGLVGKHLLPLSSAESFLLQPHQQGCCSLPNMETRADCTRGGILGNSEMFPTALGPRIHSHTHMHQLLLPCVCNACQYWSPACVWAHLLFSQLFLETLPDERAQVLHTWGSQKGPWSSSVWSTQCQRIHSRLRTAPFNIYVTILWTGP